MQHDDSHRPPRAFGSQQLITFGVLALLFMAILGASVSGTGSLVGTLVLAVVSVTCFVLAVRASHRESK